MSGKHCYVWELGIQQPKIRFIAVAATSTEAIQKLKEYIQLQERFIMQREEFLHHIETTEPLIDNIVLGRILKYDMPHVTVVQPTICI